jgi:hypothetical protein
MRMLLGLTLLLGLAGTAAAEPVRGAVQLAIVDESGAPVYCTRDSTDGHGRPAADGGYRLEALRPGKWIVRLELPYERVDVAVTATAGETVVVPPVVARGRCHSIVLTRRLELRQLVYAQPATWSVSFDRTYAAHAAAPRVVVRKLIRGPRPDVALRTDPNETPRPGY